MTRVFQPIRDLNMKKNKSKNQDQLEIAKNKVVECRMVLKDTLIERDEEVDITLTSLICGENPLLVGQPGTAKSLLLNSIMKWMGSVPLFSIQLNRFTVSEEVFGPVSLNGLKEDKFRRITTGRLPEAVGAYIDEIFKGSSAILNTLLMALNERMFDNGDGTFRKIPLLLCVAASNEWPNTQEELSALFDRFLFRKSVKYIASKSGRDKLLWDGNHIPEFTQTITVNEIKILQSEARTMLFPNNVKESFNHIIDELAKEGIRPGDRRMYKSVQAVKSYAVLNDRETSVEIEDLEILSHTMWVDPTEQPEKAAKIISKIANPTGATINDKLLQIQEIIDAGKPNEAVPKLQAIRDELQALPSHVRKTQALKFVSEALKSQYSKVVGVNI